MKRLIILILALTLLLSGCVQSETPTIPETTIPQITSSPLTTTPEDIIDTTPTEVVFDEDLEKILNDALEVLKYSNITMTSNSVYISDNAATLSWSTSYMVNALFRAYQMVGKIEFLDTASIILYRTFNLATDSNGDGYLNWGTSNYSSDKKTTEEYCVHTGVYTSVAGEIANLVYSYPALAEKNTPFEMTYKQFADFLIDKAVNHMIPSFDKDWNEEIGIYMDSSDGGNWEDREYPTSLPHNQYLAMAVSLLQFSKLSPENAEKYIHRANKMFDAFKSVLSFKPSGRVYWNYSDRMYEHDAITPSSEDYSHGQWDVRAVIQGYMNGMVFSLEELNAFVYTYENTMFKGTEENPLLSNKVNGGGSGGYIRLFLFDMAPYGTKIWQRARRYFEVNTNLQKEKDTLRILAYHEKSPKPNAFSLVSPAYTEENVKTDYALLRWSPSLYATNYTVTVAKDREFQNIVLSRSKIIETNAYISGLESNSVYYWKVTAYNASGESTESQTFIFKTA